MTTTTMTTENGSNTTDNLLEDLLGLSNETEIEINQQSDTIETSDDDDIFNDNLSFIYDYSDSIFENEDDYDEDINNTHDIKIADDKASNTYVYIHDSEGNDNYVINNMKSFFYINDNEGTDSIIFDESLSGKISYLFDVESPVRDDSYHSNNLWFYDKDSVSYNETGKLNRLTTIEIKDFYAIGENGYDAGYGVLETIKYSESNEQLAVDDSFFARLNEIGAEVEAWLSSHNEYKSAYEVMFKGNESDVSALLNIYQNADNINPELTNNDVAGI